MKIEITYNSGEKYIAYIADESYENVIACLMDDVSVSVIHSIGKVEENKFCNAPTIIAERRMK